MGEQKKRKAIPAKILKVLQKEINSKCPICGSQDVEHFEIHHIDEKSSNNKEVNLIMICPTCHSKVTKGDISMEEVILLKIKLIKGYNCDRKRETSKKIININSTVNKSIIANQLTAKTINIKGSAKTKINHPEDSIGANLTMRNYIKHLIDRYQDYMKEDYSKNEKTKYTIIHRAIKREFGVDRYTFVHIKKFYELVDYLQFRIDNTIIGKRNNRLNIKNYSSLEEYLIKYKLNL